MKTGIFFGSFAVALAIIGYVVLQPTTSKIDSTSCTFSPSELRNLSAQVGNINTLSKSMEANLSPDGLKNDNQGDWRLTDVRTNNTQNQEEISSIQSTLENKIKNCGL